MINDDQLLPPDDDRDDENENTGTNPDDQTPPGGAEVTKELTQSLKQILFQQEEISFARHHRNAGAEFIAGLDRDQKSQLLDMMRQNDRDNFELHKKKLDNEAAATSQKIKSKGEGIRSIKLVVIVAISAFIALTVFFGLVLQEYVSQWLAFITGLFGGGLSGYGFSKSRVLDFNNVGKKNTTTEDDDEE